MDSLNQTESLRFNFTGKGGDFFFILLKNVFFTMITLGIYFFWAKVNVQKYLYQKTEFYGSNFDYHATGKERFLGFLKGLLILIPAFLVLYVIQILLVKIFGVQVGAILSAIVFYLTLIMVYPVIKTGSLRYNLSRTSFKNVRFRFVGRPTPLLKIYLKGLLLVFVTLGIYYPWFLCQIQKYIYQNTKIGNESFDYHGDGKELFIIILKGFFLTIITLGIYGAWMQADILRYQVGKTTFQNKKFQSDITGGVIFKNLLIIMCLIIFTLGIGFAWAIMRTQKIILNSIFIQEAPDIEKITAVVDEKASALADGLREAGNLLDTLADFIG